MNVRNTTSPLRFTATGTSASQYTVQVKCNANHTEVFTERLNEPDLTGFTEKKITLAFTHN
jgi:hypothetical protein